MIPLVASLPVILPQTQAAPVSMSSTNAMKINEFKSARTGLPPSTVSNAHGINTGPLVADNKAVAISLAAAQAAASSSISSLSSWGSGMAKLGSALAASASLHSSHSHPPRPSPSSSSSYRTPPS